MKVLNVVGARPNFMQMAPIVEQMRKTPEIHGMLVHTGQHYDQGMSDIFFQELGIPRPDVHLGVGSGTHAEQTARVLTAFEKVCLDEKPDWVVVVGDVNSTMACTLVAAKLLIRVAHVEAGLRSNDRTMPVVLTDSGCLQEETTMMRIPCLTLRNDTERPATIMHSTNIMTGTNRDRILAGFRRVISGEWRPSGPPELWSGHAAEV